MQLVAYGAQDIYLTGQPQITFFKAVYRRHTNFALESIRQTIQGTNGLGRRVTVTADRRGDLILGAYLQIEIQTGATQPTTQKLYSYENLCVVDEAELEIGGVQIDRIFGDWMTLYAELVYRKGYSTLLSVAAGDNVGSDTLGTTLNNLKNAAGGGAIYIPLLFWFQNNPGLAIPLIALQYHEVRFNILWCPAGRVGTAGVGFTGAVVQLENSLGSGATDVADAITNASFFLDYAYLDTTERRKFAQNAHEYLITQHQTIDTNVSNVTTVNQNLNQFNHPVKYLAWRFWSGADASFLGCDTYTDGKITFNGQDRFEVRPSSYFENMQIQEFWPCGGNQLTYSTQVTAAAESDLNGKWSLYSFAIRPAEHQPSGTCNFSRIDNSQLIVNAVSNSALRLTIHAENYNVLRIMSGMGGLAYSN